jgi:hypothetical protein
MRRSYVQSLLRRNCSLGSSHANRHRDKFEHSSEHARIDDFGEEDVAKIMGGNLMKLLKVSKPVNA